MRRTTSAAFTRALSVRHGCDPWPAVPEMRRLILHQPLPFSATITGSLSRCPRAREEDAARLGDHVVGLHRVAFVVDQVARSVGAEGFLVGDREIGERALRAEAVLGQPSHRHRHRRREVEHVDRAPTPHLAVDELAAEGVVAPALGVGRHHVGVAHEQQARCARVASFDAHGEALASVHRLVGLAVEARMIEVGGQRVYASILMPTRNASIVHALVPDEVLQQVGHVGGDVGHGASVRGCTIPPRHLSRWLTDASK